jgi:hypothetical protein
VDRVLRFQSRFQYRERRDEYQSKSGLYQMPVINEFIKLC